MRKIVNRFFGLTGFKNIVKTATFRQSTITFSGTAINGLLGAFFYILIARFLGPSSFGLLSVAVATLTLISDIGDLGTDTGLVNFVSRYLKKDFTKAKRFLKLGLKVKVIIGVAIAVAGLFLSDIFAGYVFAKPELSGLLKISFLGVLAVLLFSFITHSLQATQKFWHWSGIQVGTNALRLLTVIILIVVGVFSMENVLILYISVPLIGFLISYRFLPKNFFSVKNENTVAREFFKYNKWIALFTLVAAVSSRLDTFITARLLSSIEIGIYSAANQLAQIIPQTVTALGTVIAPKMAGIGTVEDLKQYLKKTQIMVVGISLAALLFIPVIPIVIPFIYGTEYLASVPVFTVLLFGMLLYLISVPAHSAVFYYYSYPKLFFYLSLGHLFIIASLGWYLISLYGVMGAAVSVLVGAFFNFIIPVIWLIRKMKR